MSGLDAGTRSVRLLDLPVQTWRRLQQHHDEVLREFALIAMSAHHGSSQLPARLLTLVAEIRSRFAVAGEEFRALVDEAFERGRDRIDLEIALPVDVAAWVEDYALLFDAADEFCREGQLLTLATPADLARFRRWLTSQIREQLLGSAEPTAWRGER